MRRHDRGKSISGRGNTREISRKDRAKLSFKERQVIVCKWGRIRKSPVFCGLNLTSGNAV